MYEVEATAAILIAFFIALGIAMNKGSAITAKIFALSWEDIIVILGAVMSLVLQLMPLFPSIPVWLPVVLAIVIKAIKDLHSSTVVARAQVAKGR